MGSVAWGTVMPALAGVLKTHYIREINNNRPYNHRQSTLYLVQA